MKKVFLIGDSIRYGANGINGYGYYVNEMLNGVAEVYQPNENCRMAQYTLRYLHDWVQGFGVGEDIDVVHWNNGLWDVLRICGDDPLTPVDQYVSLLERIAKRIRLLFPNAHIIFALNTPVIEEWGRPEFFRFNSDIEEYNRAANALMQRLDIEVNDLYSTAKSFPDTLHSDWVHYTEEGSRILAAQACKHITAHF